MAEENESSAESALGSATETLSQLLARILGQLSLSAWLPSAALTLLVAFTIQLGTVLDRETAPKRPWPALSQASSDLGRTSVGGLILMVVVIVVLTMLTQAFSFESIRLLEGYWGTSWLAERVAQARAEHFRKDRASLERRQGEQRKAAWAGTQSELQRIQQEQIHRGQAPVFTPNVIHALGAPVLGYISSVVLTEEEKKRVGSTNWKEFASPDPLRRELNIKKRLDDFPVAQNMRPTRLGNVLRHYEDKTGRETVESFVGEIFDSLPLSLRVSHDEQRSRLDLYCSMIFVMALVTVVAVARFQIKHWGYSVAAVGLGFIVSVVVYRAAVASARYYGSLLVTIDAVSRRQQSVSASTRATPTAVVSRRRWRIASARKSGWGRSDGPLRTE